MTLTSASDTWTLHATHQRALAAFQAAHASLPTHVAAAPGRVNLIGEHTDYTGGFVLPIAIDRACVVTGRLSANPQRSRIVTEHSEESLDVDLLAPLSPGVTLSPHHTLSPGQWPSYVVGVLAVLAHEARRAGASIFNLDLAIASSVPLGGGLSSSAALEMAVCTAAASLWNIDLPPRARAVLCRKAEHEFAGVPCGIMDQYISAMGARDHALLIDCRTQECVQVPMPSLDDAAVLVINSNVRHSLASGEYAQRRDACALAAHILGVPELRDATEQLVARSSALAARPDLFPIARHVVTENARTLSAAAALQAGDLETFGSLMNASHNSLRDDYRVSCPELDTLVDLARNTPGIYGARMTGGGFGGCIVALARAADAANASRHILAGYRAAHARDAAAFTTLASDGAHLL